MSHQKFDSKTTKKLLTNYQNTISKYASENEQLTRQLEDLKTTLTLNQNLLYDFIKSSVGEDESITALINESKQLWAENESLIKQKNDLEMKTAKLQELIEDTPTQIREEINLINAQNNKMKIELVQKDNTIKKLKNDLDKARKNALFKTARTEILVTEPTKTNVEINHELLNTKTILTKVSAMHAAEKSIRYNEYYISFRIQNSPPFSSGRLFLFSIIYSPMHTTAGAGSLLPAEGSRGREAPLQGLGQRPKIILCRHGA